MVTKAKRTRHDRYSELLPIHTPTGSIHGFVCDDWMVGQERLGLGYKACCQDPRNWEGEGEFAPLEHVDWPGVTFDPYYDGCGFRSVRDVHCKVCGYRQCATEYSTKEVKKEGATR